MVDISLKNNCCSPNEVKKHSEVTQCFGIGHGMLRGSMVRWMLQVKRKDNLCQEIELFRLQLQRAEVLARHRVLKNRYGRGEEMVQFEKPILRELIKRTLSGGS